MISQVFLRAGALRGGKGQRDWERGEGKEGEMGRESVLVFRGHTGMSLI